MKVLTVIVWLAMMVSNSLWALIFVVVLFSWAVFSHIFCILFFIYLGGLPAPLAAVSCDDFMAYQGSAKADAMVALGRAVADVGRYIAKFANFYVGILLMK